MHIAWVFPGQGSQKLGMGKDVISIEDAKSRFDYASDIFDINLFKICEEESEKDIDYDLNNTKNTQICLFLVESILLDALKQRGCNPDFVAGHSLGEITALYAAKVLSFENCVSLIKIRSELMSKAPDGSMAAIIGFDRETLESLLKDKDDVYIANDNSASQVVLSGNKDKLDEISQELNCKRFIPLNVSGAFHSRYMNEPSVKFSGYLDSVCFCEPFIPVISNANPFFSKDSVQLKQNLKKQMCNGVRWRETMDLMSTKDDLHIVEIGPSNVLGGLAKRHLKNIKISQVSSANSLFYESND
tara:strand:- start:425 stop:1330 length:906 start_codon:yes stop_codon:yes gene_type:complete